MPQPGRSREGLARGPSEKATNSAVIHRKRCSALKGLQSRPLESLLHSGRRPPGRGFTPEPRRKGVPPCGNLPKGKHPLGTPHTGACRPCHPCPTVRRLESRQRSGTAGLARRGQLLGCELTRRETRVEKLDCASVALSRRDGRHLVKNPPLIRNRLIFVFCRLR
jgi:hypothetical protein